MRIVREGYVMWQAVFEQRRHSLGGFDVGRVLPVATGGMVGPFIFLDHMGPVDLPAGLPHDADVRPHPHIGLSTITYLFSGQIVHRDSVGSHLPIEPGEVNWMVAGRGITHSERFERARARGDRLHGVQAWVALPRDAEEVDPSFSHLAADALPVMQAEGVRVRLVAGRAFGLASPVPVHSPLAYAHVELAAGASLRLPDDYPSRALFVVGGSIEGAGRGVASGWMGVLAPGPASVRARKASVLMLLAGEPVGPRYIDWNFVSSSRERIAEARADWMAGRMAAPVGDGVEFTPAPAVRDTGPRLVPADWNVMAGRVPT